MVSRNHASFITALLLLTPLAVSYADGTVSGRCRFEKIKGRPSAGYIELYEWNIFLASDGGLVEGQSYRCGHEYGDGTYHFTAPAGGYTMYVSQPIFFARPKLVTGVQISDGQTTTVNPELNLDYSCYYMDQWEWGSPWYQTFVATGTSINRIQWRIAGWNCSSIAVSVRESNGGNVTTWPQVGPTKTANTGYGDMWTGYRSGDIPTTPGQTYAVKLTGQGGDFAIDKRNEDGNGYTQGQAFDSGGNPRTMDLNITVFSDNDGTLLAYAKTTHGLGSLTGWAGTWGQTFRATGNGLAAADLWYASTTWDIGVRFRIFTNDPSGTQIGPTKTSRGAAQTGGVGLVGVSYAPGEVPLTPGNTYYIEMSVPDDPWGFTPYQFDEGVDDYPYGMGYMSSGPQSNVDLNMTIMEYAGPAPQPRISRSPATLTPTTPQGEDAPNQTFAVFNSGDGTLDYTITDDRTWMSVQPSSGTSDGEIDTITVIYDTASMSGGQYSGTITISDPNATNDPQTIAVDLTIEGGAATPAGFYKVGWNLTSVPVEPSNPDPTAVFQDLVSLGNVIDYNLYRYETGAGYRVYPDHFLSISRGQGYWLWLSTVNPTTVVSIDGAVATTDQYLPLFPPGWHLVGHPFPQPVPLSNCQLTDGVTTHTFADAVAAGWIAATVYYWEPGVGYQTLTSAGYGHDTSLRPWRGYWFNALASDLELIVPPPG